MISRTPRNTDSACCVTSLTPDTGLWVHCRHHLCSNGCFPCEPCWFLLGFFLRLFWKRTSMLWLPSVLWCCWLGSRKGIRLVKKYGEDGGGGHWLVRMEWRPAGWSVCLPLLIFPCTIKSRSSLLALAHLGGPGKRAIKWLCCGGGTYLFKSLVGIWVCVVVCYMAVKHGQWRKRHTDTYLTACFRGQPW